MCEIGKSFNNINSYNSSMAAAMKDKLFFTDKLPNNKKYVFVDFGCANGEMINHLIDIYGGKNNVFIGYDCSETMIDLAKSNYGENADKALFTTDWNEVIEEMNKFNLNYKKVLILSSVIHEVYSYTSNDNDIKTFWKRVKNSGFDYIVVRDMMAHKDMNYKSFDKDKIIGTEAYYYGNPNTNIKWILKSLDDFEKKWGSIDNRLNFVHYLLKYRWKTNWERELNENYFPIFIEDFMDMFKNTKYRLEFFDNFKIKVLEEQWKKDLNIEIEDNTHIKAIFKKV